VAPAYVAANAGYAALLAAFLAAGALLGAPSLSAVGGTFFALWASEKGVEVLAEFGDAQLLWLLGLFASVGAWRCGAALAARPAWLTGLAGLGDALVAAPPAA
jgi:hypothetical protein